jgi:purine-binding chemotaxis protein CheW
VDLRKLFGTGRVEAHKKNRILIADLEKGRLIGLLVNSASEVLKIPATDIVPPGTMFAEGESTYVTGVGKLKNRLIVLLDLPKLLQQRELKRVEEAAELVSAT